MRKPAILVVSLGALLGCSRTQLPPTPQAASLKTEDAEIEIIGLREWTLEMVQDSLAKYAPEDGLATHACAAALRTKLGFADASVSISFSRPGMRRVDIAVVEPVENGDPEAEAYAETAVAVEGSETVEAAAPDDPADA